MSAGLIRAYAGGCFARAICPDNTMRAPPAHTHKQHRRWRRRFQRQQHGGQAVSFATTQRNISKLVSSPACVLSRRKAGVMASTCRCAVGAKRVRGFGGPNRREDPFRRGRRVSGRCRAMHVAQQCAHVRQKAGRVRGRHDLWMLLCNVPNRLLFVSNHMNLGIHNMEKQPYEFIVTRSALAVQYATTCKYPCTYPVAVPSILLTQYSTVCSY